MNIRPFTPNRHQRRDIDHMMNGNSECTGCFPSHNRGHLPTHVEFHLAVQHACMQDQAHSKSTPRTHHKSPTSFGVYLAVLSQFSGETCQHFQCLMRSYHQEGTQGYQLQEMEIDFLQFQHSDGHQIGKVMPLPMAQLVNQKRNSMMGVC